jgi:DNA-3-methyladenine glycosylase
MPPRAAAARAAKAAKTAKAAKAVGRRTRPAVPPEARPATSSRARPATSSRARSATPSRERPATPAAPPAVPPPTPDQLRAAALDRAFFARDPAEVARALVGCAIVHGERAVMIVETEAYRGPEDLASHARFGRTTRTAPMFGPPGHAYVYLCYGTHQMFNVVTGVDGEASAVLVRAAAPLYGVEDEVAVARGPGKLAAALGLHRGQSGEDLTRPDAALWLASWRRPPRLGVGARVGVAYAATWAEAPLRFCWLGHPAVSRPAPVTPWR